MKKQGYSQSFLRITAIIFLILSLIIFSSCPTPTDGSGATITPDVDDEDTDEILEIIPKSWWGPYEALHSGSFWYISASDVKMDLYYLPPGEQYATPIPTFTPATADDNTIASADYTLERVVGGDGLTKVTNGSNIYYLYPTARQGASFSGSIAGNAAVQRALGNRDISGSISGLGDIKTIVKNKNNPSDTQETITASDGSFSIPDAIPGDEYEVIPVIDDAELSGVYVWPLDNGSNVGTIAVVDTAYNFKASTTYPAGTPFLFADGSTEYTLTIRVHNSGSQTSDSPTWTVSSGTPGLSLLGTTMNNMQSIESNNYREFTVRVIAAPITEDYEDKKINIKLEIYEGVTWEDSVTVRFWKNDRLSIFFAAQYGARAAIITPEGKLVAIGVSGSTPSTEIPRKAQGIKIALSGASTSSETKYALSIGTQKTYSWDTYVLNRPGFSGGLIM